VVGRGIKRLRSWPVLLAALYLTLIPAFAGVYCILGHRSFYDSNARLEAAADAGAAGLRASLTKALVDHLGDIRWHTRFARHIAVKLHPETIRVNDIEFTTEERLLLQVEGGYGSYGETPLLAGTFRFWVEPELHAPAGAEFRPGHQIVRLVPVALTRQTGSSLEEPKPSEGNPPVSLLFPFPGNDGRERSRTSGTFTMSEATYDTLEEFRGAVEGDPSYDADHFWTFFYLSAITITTLGFGDITPVTEAARLWIAAEAIAGIIVIGLFLGLLVRERRKDGAEPARPR
jgi:hypothetical protein